MKVLLVNTSDSIGGAAIACRRLMDALTRNGVEVRMLNAPKRRGLLCKAIERVMLLPFMGFSWKKSWTIDVNWLGTDITDTEEFRWADVVHLHWVNQGMLSIAQISRIAKSGKRMVWTMHDVWNATAVCHLTLDCTKFTDRCAGCHITKSRLADHTWQRKRRLYESSDITFTTCSEWLRGQALQSGLMRDQRVVAIPNPIDTSIFHPSDRTEARKALFNTQHPTPNTQLILFVAQRLDNPFKGATYLIEAVKQAATKNPDIGVMIMGSNGSELAALLPGIKTYDLGYQSDPHRIARIYAAADVFVLPSLSENLPNTIMEAMACGVPSVGFRVGGIPEMIDHRKNGYVAEYRNADDLCNGILYCLNPDNQQHLRDNCLCKVEQTYSQTAVANRFMDIYKESADKE